MSKFLLTGVEIIIDGHDLSNHCFSIDTPEESDQVDVSGFNPNRVREFLAGLRDQTITLSMLQDFADGPSGGPHSVLSDLYVNATVFEIWIKADGSAAASPSNPIFGGDAQLFSYNGLSGELNARSEIQVTIKPASNTAFVWQSYDAS